MDGILPLASMAAQTVIFGLGVYAIIIRNESNLKAVKDEMAEIKDSMTVISETVTKVAVQNVRLDNLSERMNAQDRAIDDLRRGRGFIRENRQGLDGEYKG